MGERICVGSLRPPDPAHPTPPTRLCPPAPSSLLPVHCNSCSIPLHPLSQDGLTPLKLRATVGESLTYNAHSHRSTAAVWLDLTVAWRPWNQLVREIWESPEKHAGQAMENTVYSISWFIMMRVKKTKMQCLRLVRFQMGMKTQLGIGLRGQWYYILAKNLSTLCWCLEMVGVFALKGTGIINLAKQPWRWPSIQAMVWGFVDGFQPSSRWE